MKEAEILAILRNTLAILCSIANRADMPALAFLIGMAELEAAQTKAGVKRKRPKN